MRNKRIWIFGGTASGKTTLAKKLSNKLKIPFESTDNFVYKTSFKIKYPEKTRDKKIEQFSKKKNWIIEGVHRADWILNAFAKSNFVIILKPRRLIQIKRVLTRELLDKKPKPIKDILTLIKYAWIYKKDNFIYHQKFIKEYNKRYIMLKNDKEISDFIKKIK